MSAKTGVECFVPNCGNSRLTVPKKKFARVPTLLKIRQLWLEAGLGVQGSIPQIDKSPMYCCEDHFNLTEDATRGWLTSDCSMTNFIKLKRGVLPHIFHQKNTKVTKPQKRLISVKNTYKPRKNQVAAGSSSYSNLEIKKEVHFTNDKIVEIVIEEAPELEGDDASVKKTYAERNASANHDHEYSEKDDLKKHNNETESDFPLSKTASGRKSRLAEGNSNLTNDKNFKLNTSGCNKNSEKADKSTKKRRVVKEILAWIPSTSDTPRDVRSTSEHPFLVVHSPSLPADTGSYPVLPLPPVVTASKELSVATLPLPDDKESKFILTLPDPSLGSVEGQQVVLALPQGASFAVNKLGENGEELPTTIDTEGNAVPACDDEVSESQLPSSAFAAGSNNSSKKRIIKKKEGGQKRKRKPSQLSIKRQLESLRKLPPNLEEVVKEFRSMKLVLENLNSELVRLRVENDQLKAHTDYLSKDGGPLSDIKKLELAADILKGKFSPNEVSALLHNKKTSDDVFRVKWNDEELTSAFNLYTISPQAYKYCLSEMNFPLPSIHSVKKFIINLGEKFNNYSNSYMNECLNGTDKGSQNKSKLNNILEKGIKKRQLPKYVRVNIRKDDFGNPIGVEAPLNRGDVKIHRSPQKTNCRNPANYIVKPIVKQVIRVDRNAISPMVNESSENVEFSEEFQAGNIEGQIIEEVDNIENASEGEGTFYEEVVIECDDPSLFEDGIITLATGP